MDAQVCQAGFHGTPNVSDGKLSAGKLSCLAHRFHNGATPQVGGGSDHPRGASRGGEQVVPDALRRHSVQGFDRRRDQGDNVEPRISSAPLRVAQGNGRLVCVVVGHGRARQLLDALSARQQVEAQAGGIVVRQGFDPAPIGAQLRRAQRAVADIAGAFDRAEVPRRVGPDSQRAQRRGRARGSPRLHACGIGRMQVGADLGGLAQLSVLGEPNQNRQQVVRRKVVGGGVP